MRRYAIALSCVGTAAGLAAAQVPPPSPVMPGTPVGRPLVLPVGNQIPSAVPGAGERIGTGPGGLPSTLDPRLPKPPGQVIDLTNVIAPYPGMPKPAPSFWDRLVESWNSLLSGPPEVTPPPNWTPGIGRRNRERARERMWRRD